MKRNSAINLILIVLLITSLVFFFLIYSKVENEKSYFGAKSLNDSLWIHPKNMIISRIEKVKEISGIIKEVNYEESTDLYTLVLLNPKNSQEQTVTLPKITEEGHFGLLQGEGIFTSISADKFKSNLSPTSELYGSLVTDEIYSNSYKRINYIYL